MAFQEINRGTGADTGDGDSLRAGGLKVNTNFGEIYTETSIHRIFLWNIGLLNECGLPLLFVYQ